MQEVGLHNIYNKDDMQTSKTLHKLNPIIAIAFCLFAAAIAYIKIRLPP